MDNVNPVTRSIADHVSEAVPITTLFVRGQMGKDLEITYNTLAGMGRNPNLAGVVIVGLEETSTNTVADRVRNTGKPVENGARAGTRRDDQRHGRRRPQGQPHGDRSVQTATPRVPGLRDDPRSRMRRVGHHVRAGVEPGARPRRRPLDRGRRHRRHHRNLRILGRGRHFRRTGSGRDRQEGFPEDGAGSRGEGDGSRRRYPGRQPGAGQHPRRPDHHRGKGAGRDGQVGHHAAGRCPGVFGKPGNARACILWPDVPRPSNR